MINFSVGDSPLSTGSGMPWRCCSQCNRSPPGSEGSKGPPHHDWQHTNKQIRGTASSWLTIYFMNYGCGQIMSNKRVKWPSISEFWTTSMYTIIVQALLTPQQPDLLRARLVIPWTSCTTSPCLTGLGGSSTTSRFLRKKSNNPL